MTVVPRRMQSLFVPYAKRRGIASGGVDSDEGSGVGHHPANGGTGIKAERKGLGSRRPEQRLVFKNGECNVTRANIKKRRQRYMADIFTTLVDIKWRWNLLNFVLAFMLSWLIFGLLWWLICFSHGDLQNYGQPGHRPCVEEVYDFTTALLFSIETQQTIGYGSRHTNPHCPEAILVMMFQSCFGVIIQALMTGLVFAKLSRPKKRAETLLFSKNAVVCKRDGQMCLLFRVGDMRKSHIVEAHVRAIMIKKRVTHEGEVIPLYQYDLKLGDGETEGRLFMVWPVIVEHRIDEDSPLWDMSAEDLSKSNFELVVVLEGIVESTGMTTQARTSYLPDEILWGHRFERLVSFQRESGQYLIDYSRFHSTISLEIPRCSARELDEMRRGSVLSTEDDDEEDDEDEDEEDVEREEEMDGMGDGKVDATGWVCSTVSAILPPRKHRRSHHHHQLQMLQQSEDDDDLLRRRRMSIQSLLKTNGINGIALAAFDLQNEEQSLNIIDIRCCEAETVHPSMDVVDASLLE